MSCKNLHRMLFTKIELADKITKRCQRYKLNKLKWFSSDSSYFSWAILKISQCCNSPHIFWRYLGVIFPLIKKPFINLKTSISTDRLPNEIKMSFRHSTLLTLQGFELKIVRSHSSLSYSYLIQCCNIPSLHMNFLSRGGQIIPWL